MNPKAKAMARLASLPVEQVKECARALFHSGDEGDEPFSWTLDALEDRMTETDYVAFCMELCEN